MDSLRSRRWWSRASLGLVVLAVVVGFAANQLLSGDDDPRTVVATVNESVLPAASGRLELQGDGENGAILRVQGMPSLDTGEVYQAWVARDKTFIPQPTFEVGDTGGGAVAIPDDLAGADQILVTREPRGGARAPGEVPILSVGL